MQFFKAHNRFMLNQGVIFAWVERSRVRILPIAYFFKIIFRFQYPERPTLFFAMCYLGVSLVCLVGLISPSSIVCSDKIVNEDNVIEHGNGLIQGATSRPCTILFMLFFYFSSKCWRKIGHFRVESTFSHQNPSLTS